MTEASALQIAQAIVAAAAGGAGIPAVIQAIGKAIGG